nr:hypothetical protein BaRGS_022506 [Batillaria attramentaria]
MSGLENANPLVFQRSDDRPVLPEEEDDDIIDKIDDREVFDLIRAINDPEHPLSLEELNVVEESKVKSGWEHVHFARLSLEYNDLYLRVKQSKRQRDRQTD